jgi:hypothetical protein
MVVLAPYQQINFGWFGDLGKVLPFEKSGMVVRLPAASGLNSEAG